ncbi:MAG: tetratricopeptide repeat protein [Deltaproteobacteria bacterium]|nr:tetratricopeptide repeat protein [Deltaproteobacteria bacterium]
MKQLHSIFLLILSMGAITMASSSSTNKIKIQKKSTLKLQQYNSDTDYSVEKQALLNKKRVTLIQDIKKFIREAKSVDQKTELNLRLGSLYMEEYHFMMSQAQTQFEKETAHYNKENKGGGRPPQLDTSEATASQQKAKTLYRDLFTRYPSHPKRSEFMYFLAILSQDQGNIKESMGFLKRITEESPSSKYYNEALVQLGDYFFDTNKFSDAELYFNKVIAKKDPKTLHYATYKKAWCAYNGQKYQASLNLFKSIIESESTENSNYLMRLKNEALRDIALPLTELHLGEEAISFFRAQGDPFHRTGVESMANLAMEKGDYKNSILFNEYLLGMDNNGAKNPNYDLSLIESLRLSGNNSRAVQRLFTQLPNYMEGASWYELNAATPAVIKSAATGFEEMARKYALEFHSEGQKTKNDTLYETASTLYQKYLTFFPGTIHAATIRFYLAEIFYKQQKYLPAADNYYLVYKSPLAGNMRLEAIHSALDSLNKEMNLARKTAGISEISVKTTSRLKESDEKTVETPLTSVESKFVIVGEEYISHFPKANDTMEVVYKISYLNYTHLNLSAAYKGFWNIVQNYPGHTTSYGSGYLILDILNRQKEYSKLVVACQKFLVTKQFTKSDFRNDVADVLRHAELKKILLVETKGNYKEAAEAYLEYTKAYGTQDELLHEKALFNASVNFFKHGDTLASLEIQERFLRRFPNSQSKENILLQVAKTYETLANFEKAALYYEQLAMQFPTQKQANTALRLSGLYYWGSKNYTKAEAVMKTHIDRYPKEASIVVADLLELYESQGDRNKLIRHYYEARAQKGISYADYLGHTLKLAELQGLQKGGLSVSLMEEALKITQKFQKDLLSTKAGIEHSTRVFFWFATQKEQLFYRIKLALPQRQLDLNLARKLALVKELEKEFSHVAKLGGGDWGLGSIYKTSLAFRQLAQDITQAPVPAELTGEQLEQYRIELKKQMVIPFNEKALSLVGRCLDTAQEFNLQSQWTPKCYSLGSEINPERYPAIKTFYLPTYRVAVMDVNTQSKIPAGSVSTYPYPFDSAALFHSSQQERALASNYNSLPVLFEGSSGFSGENSRSAPTPLTYKLLGVQRRETLQKALDETTTGKKTNYGYLHYLRLINPQKAEGFVLNAIQKDPNNRALHNLLGLCYLDMGQYTAARVTWLSLLARGVESSEVENNLGVLFTLMGKEKQGVEYFKMAAEKDSALEALNNLGFVALKYRNGFQAKQFFQRAIALNKNDAMASVGLGVAKLQNREFDAAKESLALSATTFASDPFATLSYAYLLLDVDKEQAQARKVIEDYSKNQNNIETDPTFRQVIQDVNRVQEGSGSSESNLPSL